jgi:regulator of replication initiation timing
MSDHAHFEELTALAARGYLSDEEYAELREHLRVCPECRESEQAFRALVCSGVPLARGEFSRFVDQLSVRPDTAVRDRFLARARREGLRLAPNVDKPASSRRFQWLLRPATATGLAGVILVGLIYGIAVYQRSVSTPLAVEKAGSDKREIADLTSRLDEREQELAGEKKQIQDLRTELGNAVKDSEKFRLESEQKGVRLGQSTSQTAQLVDELENRDKQLATTTDEIARIKQLRAIDGDALVAQQARIREISDQLRVANATVEMERQLAAEGQNIRELLAARQLHVIDVRDGDVKGNLSRPFARVFVTEGKSLTFFAFDLNSGSAIDAKAHFQVWGEELGKKGSLRSLGSLNWDSRASNRWTLNVENPDLLKQINSVFVTIASQGADNSGQRLLYAYLGDPNHS